jgi:hypothetical protein
VVAVVTLSGCRAATSATSAAPASSSTSPAVAAAPRTGPASSGSAGVAGSPVDQDDPVRYAAQVETYARQARIHSQLLMAILYNESYKPHDPAFERAWHQVEPDSAFGVANMHEKAFDDTKRGRDFAARRWDELPDDPALAIEAAAWYLHDLGARLPASWAARYSRDDLLALGYDAGPGNMLAFSRGGRLLPAAQTYLQKLHENWATAAAALRHR